MTRTFHGHTLPDWVQYVAMSPSGIWACFDTRPRCVQVKRGGGWIPEGRKNQSMRALFGKNPPPAHDWRESLTHVASLHRDLKLRLVAENTPPLDYVWHNNEPTVVWTRSDTDLHFIPVAHVKDQLIALGWEAPKDA